MCRNRLFINLVVGFVKLTGLFPAFLFLKPKIVYLGKRRPPAPSIIVSNHKSLMDFVLYLLIFPFRTIRFLMAEVLYNKGKLFGKFLNAIGGIRVDRDTFDFSFISDALEIIDNGEILGIFPEGRLPIGGKPWPFTVSTAIIATNCDAPIIPVYTNGNYGLFKRAGVVVGKPFNLNDYKLDNLNEEEQLKHLTKVLEEKVYELADSLSKREKTNEGKK